MTISVKKTFLNYENEIAGEKAEKGNGMLSFQSLNSGITNSGPFIKEVSKAWKFITYDEDAHMNAVDSKNQVGLEEKAWLDSWHMGIQHPSEG